MPTSIPCSCNSNAAGSNLRAVKALHTPDKAAIVITHYRRLLDYLKPDIVHVLIDGKIIKTGGPELALEIDEKGFADYQG